MLREFLAWHRVAVERKIAGLCRRELGRRLLPSRTTIGGLVKHLALVEDSWFNDRFSGKDPVEPWKSAPFDRDIDWDFHSAEENDATDLLALYRAACRRSEAIEAAAESLDVLSVEAAADGQYWSLRYIMIHLIEETARHLGHADILRELHDGATGE